MEKYLHPKFRVDSLTILRALRKNEFANANSGNVYDPPIDVSSTMKVWKNLAFPDKYGHKRGLDINPIVIDRAHQEIYEALEFLRTYRETLQLKIQALPDLPEDTRRLTEDEITRLIHIDSDASIGTKDFKKPIMFTMPEGFYEDPDAHIDAVRASISGAIKKYLDLVDTYKDHDWLEFNTNMVSSMQEIRTLCFMIMEKHIYDAVEAAKKCRKNNNMFMALSAIEYDPSEFAVGTRNQDTIVDMMTILLKSGYSFSIHQLCAVLDMQYPDFTRKVLNKKANGVRNPNREYGCYGKHVF